MRHPRGVWGLVAGSLVLASSSLTMADDNACPDAEDSRVVQAQYQTEAADEAEFRDMKSVRSGSSSSATRKTALGVLPLDKLTPERRAPVDDVLSSLSLFRRLPTVTFEIDPDLYVYFLRNPDVIVSIWRALDISKFELKQVADDCYHADAGDGSTGRIQILYRGAESQLVYCDGLYKSPLLVKPIHSKAVIHLQTTFTREADGRIFATHRGDLFVSFPSQTVETAARVISPVSYLLADRNFKQISLFGQMMSTAMCRQPGWVEMVANRLNGLSEERRQEFLKLSAHVYLAARKRALGGQGGEEVTLEQILAPLRQTGGPTPAAPAVPPPPAVSTAPGTTTRQ